MIIPTMQYSTWANSELIKDRRGKYLFDDRERFIYYNFFYLLFFQKY